MSRRRRHTPDQIIRKLAEGHCGHGPRCDLPHWLAWRPPSTTCKCDLMLRPIRGSWQRGELDLVGCQG
jgi:hypothetical protein